MLNVQAEEAGAATPDHSIRPAARLLGLAVLRLSLPRTLPWLKSLINRMCPRMSPCLCIARLTLPVPTRTPHPLTTRPRKSRMDQWPVSLAIEWNSPWEELLWHTGRADPVDEMFCRRPAVLACPAHDWAAPAGASTARPMSCLCRRQASATVRWTPPRRVLIFLRRTLWSTERTRLSALRASAWYRSGPCRFCSSGVHTDTAARDGRRASSQREVNGSATRRR